MLNTLMKALLIAVLFGGGWAVIYLVLKGLF
jgi:hypothetical protein